jgi:Protein of unknown function (DUF4238)
VRLPSIDETIEMASHHHIPLFLLNRWANDGRVFSYHWSNGTAQMQENRRTSIQPACRFNDSDSIHRVSASSGDASDQDVFDLYVDAPAENALDTMLRQGVSGLTADQRSAWARLIASFGARTPEALRVLGVADFSDATQFAAALGESALGTQSVATELLERERPVPERPIPNKTAMQLAADPAKISAVAAMDWWLRRFEGKTILFSDRPLLTEPRVPQTCGIELDDPSCLIILPVAPNTVFFATADPKIRAKVRRTPKGKLVNLINEETVWRAVKYVYAPNGSMAAFIHDRLVGKVNGRWHPK